jgi:sirohydrochlorin ferrochelatase
VAGPVSAVRVGCRVAGRTAAGQRHRINFRQKRRRAVETAVLLIAHGSRRAEANADLERLAEDLHRRGPYRIVGWAYLELARPSIAEGAADCVARGARRVLLVPYFLAAGVHVAEDLEATRAELARQFPGVEFRLAPPLGQHPLLVEVVAQRAREAEEGPTPI